MGGFAVDGRAPVGVEGLLEDDQALGAAGRDLHGGTEDHVGVRRLGDKGDTRLRQGFGGRGGKIARRLGKKVVGGAIRHFVGDFVEHAEVREAGCFGIVLIKCKLRIEPLFVEVRLDPEADDVDEVFFRSTDDGGADARGDVAVGLDRI